MSIHANPKGSGYFAKIYYNDHTGTRHEKRSYVKTEAEAKRAERTLLNARDAGTLPGMHAPTTDTPVLTVTAYLNEWLRVRRVLGGRKGPLRDSTAKRYRELIAPVVSQVGNVPLADLTPEQINGVYVSIMQSGRTAKTALNTHRILKTALTDATNSRTLAWNPIVAVSAPASKAFEAHHLTLDELNRIIVASDSTDFGPVVRLAAFTGLRLGEVIALTWDDLDLDGGTLFVRRARTTTGTLAEPKTEKSKRPVSLSADTVTMLRGVKRSQAEQKLRAGNAYTDEGFVFADALGSPRLEHHVAWAWKTIIRKAVADADEGATGRLTARKADPLLSVRFHDLRHAHAAFLRADGVEAEVVAARLGHSQVSTTLNMYSYAVPGRDVAVAKDIDRIFSAK